MLFVLIDKFLDPFSPLPIAGLRDDGDGCFQQGGTLRWVDHYFKSARTEQAAREPSEEACS